MPLSPCAFSSTPSTHPVSAGPQECHALVLWFDTLFSERFCKEHPVELSTSPNAPLTHWVQTVLLLKQPVLMAPAATAAGAPGLAVALTGQVSMARSKQTHRSLDIALRYTPQYADGAPARSRSCCTAWGCRAEGGPVGFELG